MPPQQMKFHPGPTPLQATLAAQQGVAVDPQLRRVPPAIKSLRTGLMAATLVSGLKFSDAEAWVHDQVIEMATLNLRLYACLVWMSPASMEQMVSVFQLGSGSQIMQQALALRPGIPATDEDVIHHCQAFRPDLLMTFEIENRQQTPEGRLMVRVMSRLLTPCAGGQVRIDINADPSAVHATAAAQIWARSAQPVSVMENVVRYRPLTSTQTEAPKPPPPPTQPAMAGPPPDSRAISMPLEYNQPPTSPTPTTGGAPALPAPPSQPAQPVHRPRPAAAGPARTHPPRPEQPARPARPQPAVQPVVQPVAATPHTTDHTVVPNWGPIPNVSGIPNLFQQSLPQIGESAALRALPAPEPEESEEDVQETVDADDTAADDTAAVEDNEPDESTDEPDGDEAGTEEEENGEDSEDSEGDGGAEDDPDDDSGDDSSDGGSDDNAPDDQEGDQGEGDGVEDSEEETDRHGF